MRLCKDCKHYKFIPGKESRWGTYPMAASHLCIQATSLVTGEIGVQDCSKNREVGSCGPRGDFWEPKG
jgi:hypothetical protein